MKGISSFLLLLFMAASLIQVEALNKFNIDDKGVHLDALELINTNEDLTDLFQKFFKAFENVEFRCKFRKVYEYSFSNEIEDLNLSGLAPNLRVDNIIKSHPRIRCDSRTYYQNYLYYLGSIGKKFSIAHGIEMKGGHVFLDYNGDYDTYRIVIYGDVQGLMSPLISKEKYQNYGKLTAYKLDKKSVKLELLVEGAAFTSDLYNHLMKPFHVYKILSTRNIAKLKALILRKGTSEGYDHLAEIALPYTVPSFVQLNKIDINRIGTINSLTVLQGYICEKYQMHILGRQHQWKSLLLGSFLTSVYPNLPTNIVQSIKLLAYSAPTRRPDLIYSIVGNGNNNTCQSQYLEKYNGVMVQLDDGITKFTLKEGLMLDSTYVYSHFKMKTNEHLDNILAYLRYSRTHHNITVYIRGNLSRTILEDENSHVIYTKSERVKFNTKHSMAIPVKSVHTFFDTFHLTKFTFRSKDWREVLGMYISNPIRPSNDSLIQALNFLGKLPLKIADDEIELFMKQDKRGTNQPRNFHNDMFPSLHQYYVDHERIKLNVFLEIRRASFDLAGSNIKDFGLKFLLNQTFSLDLTDTRLSLHFDQASKCKNFELDGLLSFYKNESKERNVGIDYRKPGKYEPKCPPAQYRTQFVEVKYFADFHEYMLVVSILSDDSGEHQVTTYSTFHKTYIEFMKKLMQISNLL